MSYLGQVPASAPLTSNAIPDGLITETKLANSSVSSNKIAQSAVNNREIGVQTILANNLANASVTTFRIGNSNITSHLMGTDAVESSAIAPLTSLLEDASTTGSAFGANVNVSVLDNSVVYSTAAADRNICINLRGSSTTTLNNSMETGNVLTAAVLVTNTGTPYFVNNTQIDGALVVPKVQGGSQLSAGNADSTDIYTLTVVKTGSGAFTMFLSQTQFA